MKLFILALTIIASLFIGVDHASASPAPEVIPASTACQYEDSNNCYWNAQEMGNGLGHSFTTAWLGDRECTIYWDRAFNMHKGRCWG